MPESPHWYTLRKQSPQAEFERAVMDIRMHRGRRRYKGAWYICYEIDGGRYWTMGAPLSATILINRAQIEA